MVLLGIAVSACALFTDFGDLSSGDRSPGGPETGGGTSDGARELPSEGGLANDAGDASCGHLFCEDFDDDAGLSRWQPTIVDPATTAIAMSVDAKTSSSPPSSLLVTADPVRYSSAGYLQKVFEVGEAASLRCSFDIRLEAVPSSGQFALGAIVAAEAVPAHTVALLVRGGGSRVDLVEYVVSDAGPPGNVDGPQVGMDQWRRLVVTLQRAPSPTLTVSDGVQVYTLPVPTWPTTSRLAFMVGLVFGNPYELDAAAVRARYDAIRCDAL